MSLRKKIKAVFFDIDGTLRDFETGIIPEGTKEALRKAREEQILLFVATGRHLLEMEEENLLEGIKFDGYVTLNGQYCYTLPDRAGSPGHELQDLLENTLPRSLVYHNPISREAVKRLISLIEQEPFPCMFMEADRMYINLVDENVKLAQEAIGTRVPPVLDIKRALSHEIYQIVPYITPVEEGKLINAFPECQLIRWHDGRACDMIPAFGSKDLGIQKMAEHFGISMEETAAIGDGKNDVSMIAEAGLGIAMGNGKEEAKQAADFVTDSIEQDGLRKAVFYILDYNSSGGMRHE